MKRTLMIGVAAGALLAGINIAAAQQMERQGAGAAGGASIEQKGGKAQGGAETKGGAELKGSNSRAQAPAEIKGGADMKAGDTKAGGEMKAQDQKGQKGEMKAQDTQKSGDKGRNAQSKDEKSGTSAQGDMKGSGSATTGQGAGGGAKASLTTEQKTKVRETVFKSGPRVSKTNINFNISVGTVVPRSVRFAALPPVLIEVYPQYRGYEYFIVEEEIIIIEPKTLKIVAIVNV